MRYILQPLFQLVAYVIILAMVVAALCLVPLVIVAALVVGTVFWAWERCAAHSEMRRLNRAMKNWGKP